MRAHECGQGIELTEAGLKLLDRERIRKIKSLEKQFEKLKAEIEAAHKMCPIQFLEVYGLDCYNSSYELKGRLNSMGWSNLNFKDVGNIDDQGKSIWSWRMRSAGTYSSEYEITPDDVKKMLCSEEEI